LTYNTFVIHFIIIIIIFRIAEYTTAKSLNNFCEDIDHYIFPVIFDPNLQYHQLPAQGNENVVERDIQYQQPPAQQNENVVVDPNLQYQQRPAQTNENVFNPNVQCHQPPAYLNEHFVFNSNLQNHQPPAQRNDHHTIDLDLRLSGLPTRPVYSDEYLQDQPETSTSYKYDNKNLGFDLNELPQGD